MTNRQESVEEKPTIDLKKVWKEWTSGGLRVILTWFWDEEHRRDDCCIVLIDPTKAREVPCIIPIFMAHHWALHAGIGDPDHVEHTVDKWMEDGALPGVPGNHKDRMRILNAVDSALLQLKHMPPKPRSDIAVLGEGTLMDRTTGRILLQQEYGYDV